MNTAEIRTLIILSGNKRIPELEAEIFADDELSMLYLRALYSSISLLHGVTKKSAPFLAFYYAIHMMGRRWPEAEIIIATDRMYWEAYKRKYAIFN